MIPTSNLDINLSMDKIPKTVLLPAAIIIGSIIWGGVFYASEINKQKSIEGQQKIKLKQEQKEYVAKRRNECYEIYSKEKKNWSNVRGVEYSEARDICLVTYTSKEPARPKEECGKIIEKYMSTESAVMADIILERYSNCVDNTFSNHF